jgi:hypothetical protein
VVVGLLPAILTANDSEITGYGSVLYPIRKSNIELKREYLSFRVLRERDSPNSLEAEVLVRFEFFNPTLDSVTSTIGFYAPGVMWLKNVKEHARKHYANYSIAHDGTLLPFEVYYTDCDTCELLDSTEARKIANMYGPDDDNGEFDYGFAHVFTSPITFKPGLNVVTHVYKSPGAGSVAHGWQSYILSTGRYWAGGTIGELVIDIEPGADELFYVRDDFPRESLSVLGVGKIFTSQQVHCSSPLGESGQDSIDLYSRFFRIKHGRLRIALTDFRPVTDLEFGFYRWPITYCENPLLPDALLFNGTIDATNVPNNISVERIQRNLPAAKAGHVFKDKDLAAFFEKCEWYIPDPNAP